MFYMPIFILISSNSEPLNGSSYTMLSNPKKYRLQIFSCKGSLVLLSLAFSRCYAVNVKIVTLGFSFYEPVEEIFNRRSYITTISSLGICEAT